MPLPIVLPRPSSYDLLRDEVQLRFNNFLVDGSADFKCLCKHSYREHDPITKKCTKGQCGCNVRFASTWSCSCGYKFTEHNTVFETVKTRTLSHLNNIVLEKLESGASCLGESS